MNSFFFMHSHHEDAHQAQEKSVPTKQQFQQIIKKVNKEIGNII
jgi:hypothetical protein